MNAQQNIGHYLIQSFKTVAFCASATNYPIKIQPPANSEAVKAGSTSIFRTTDK